MAQNLGQVSILLNEMCINLENRKFNNLSMLITINFIFVVMEINGCLRVRVCVCVCVFRRDSKREKYIWKFIEKEIGSWRAPPFIKWNLSILSDSSIHLTCWLGCETGVKRATKTPATYAPRHSVFLLFVFNCTKHTAYSFCIIQIYCYSRLFA